MSTSPPAITTVDSTSLLAAQTHDVVRFAMGAPAAEVIPTERFRRIAAEVLTDSSFTYGATEGEPGLIEAIVERQPAMSAHVRPERLIITSGGMQGLDLAFKLFVNPGDLVAVESPTYTNGTGTALGYGADVLEVPIDRDGMDVDALEALVAETGRAPRVIHTIPNFQNPPGTTLSEDRRRRLLDLAHRWGAMILDDDPYAELRFAGTGVPGFHEISPGDPLVFSVRTFSKVLAPGLRVGWVDASRLFETALAEGVAFIPGPALSPSGSFRTAFRLCFASTAPKRTELGVQRLAHALDLARRETLG